MMSAKSFLLLSPKALILTALMGLLASLVALVGPVGAQAGPGSQLGFGITPAHANADDPTSFSYFTHHMDPGDEFIDEARVINDSAQPVTLLVYAADATTAVNGGTAFGPMSGNNEGTADWISLDVEEVALDPGEIRIVPFKIAVPEDASPGDHVAGLVVQLASTETGSDSSDASEGSQFNVRVVQRVGIAVVVVVGGELVTALELTDLRLMEQLDEGAIFEVAVKNSGNVMASGDGSLTIFDRLGTELAEIPFVVDTILSGLSTTFQLNHPVLLVDGDYLLDSTLDFCAVRDNTTCGSASLADVELEMIDGQPTPQPESELLVPSAMGGPAVEIQDSALGAFVAAAAAALMGLMALTGSVVWRKRRTRMSVSRGA